MKFISVTFVGGTKGYINAATITEMHKLSGCEGETRIKFISDGFRDVLETMQQILEQIVK